MARLCILNAVAVPTILDLVLHIPVSLELTGGNFLRLTGIYLASAIPFFLTGIELSVVFAREPSRIPRLYGADLTGGSVACLAIVPLLNWLGGPNAILFSAFTVAVAGVVWADARRLRRAALGVAFLWAFVIAANYSGKIIDIVYAKGELRDAAWVEFARWNAISRVEVDRLINAKTIVIDADASTYIMNADAQATGTVRGWQKSAAIRASRAG